LELPDGSSSLSFIDGRYILRADGECDFAIDTALAHVTVHLAPDADEELAALLAGNLLATLLTLRGHCVLHASAVEGAHGAVAFVAGSGMGKSTLAALCCARGAMLVTDDVLRAEVTDEKAWCFRGSMELRLRKEAATLAQAIDAAPGRATFDRRTAAWPRQVRSERLPLAAIVVPQRLGDTQQLELRRVRGMDAVRELFRFPRTIGWTDPEPARRDFHVLAQIANIVPVYHVRLPPGPPFDEKMGADLLSQVA
jgi:hypothetical protein